MRDDVTLVEEMADDRSCEILVEFGRLGGFKQMVRPSEQLLFYMTRSQGRINPLLCIAIHIKQSI